MCDLREMLQVVDSILQVKLPFISVWFKKVH